MYTRYLSVLLFVGCATTTPSKEVVNSPAAKELTATDHLEAGVQFISNNLCKGAIRAFSLALATGNLNDVGRVMVYWHSGACWGSLDKKDSAAEAFSSFITAGQGILDVRPTKRYIATDEGDFVEYFELKDKMSWARAFVNFTWTSKSATYGRSEESPISVYSRAELEYLVDRIDDSCKRGCKLSRSLSHDTDVIMVVRGLDTDQFFITMIE